MGAILGSQDGISGALGVIAALLCVTQILASVVATSRFIFALARDQAIPLSKYLVKTNKHKEPWVAMAALIASLLLSTTCWVVNEHHFNGLVQAFNYYFINFPCVSGAAPAR
jgi:amino acid transporter